MGIFESAPPIKGDSISLTSSEQNYFSKVNTLLYKYYGTNLYSDSNLEISLQKKSFVNSKIMEEQLEEISWLDYILRYLNKIKKNHQSMTWAEELEELLLKESFLYTNKYLSDFFYKEYNLKTFPKVLNNNIEYIFDNELNNDISTSFRKKRNNSTNNTIQNISNSYNELDVTSHYGGSYIDMKMDNLPPNDPAFRYKMDRNLVKAYIKIFKKHMYKDKNHPINRSITLFNKTFCKYITKRLNEFKENRQNKNLTDEDYQNLVKKFETKITKCLQEFILTMYCSLKLFYSTCINFSFFKEEKDDLINLLISLFFKTGKLNETLFELYTLSYSKDIEVLRENLANLKNIKPKILEITDKYCLDEVTLELQNKIKKEKGDNNEIKNESLKNSALESIKENEEKENEDDIIIKKNRRLGMNEINTKSLIKNLNSNGKNNNEDIINTKEKNKTKNNLNYSDNSEEDDDEDDYLLSKLKDEDLSLVDIKNEGEAEADIFRKTITNFNFKTYLFPQIRNKIRDTLGQNDLYIQEGKFGNKLPKPYFSAINLLKKIRSFKTPFEKIIILAAINDQITESVQTFWNNMTQYIKNTYLFIESDELKSIFLYIFIQAQMPEILAECKIITNFTTQQTRGFNISYNLSLTEASIEKIMDMKKTKEMKKAENELKEIRKSYANLATQRFSRLSRLTQADNPFS